MRPPPLPQPTFSMSYSRAMLLELCHRAYYWQVYGSWNGDDEALDETDTRRQAWILARSKTLGGLVGELMHAFVEEVLLKGVAIGAARDSARQKLGRAVREAIQDDPDRVGRATGPSLLEVIYKTRDIEGKVVQAAEDLEAFLDALLANRIFEDIRYQRLDLVEVEARGVWPLVVCLNGQAVTLLVHVVPDVLARIPLHKKPVFVIDWKTGAAKPDAEAFQLGVYAAWAVDHQLVESIDDVRSIVVNLRDLTVNKGKGSAELVEAAKERLRSAAERALALVEDGDAERNIPKPIEAFVQVPVGSEACRFCAFRRLCGRE